MAGDSAPLQFCAHYFWAPEVFIYFPQVWDSRSDAEKHADQESTNRVRVLIGGCASQPTYTTHIMTLGINYHTGVGG